MALGRACRYSITITPSANMGFRVNIGCCELIYKTADDLIAGIDRYLQNPEGMEREYNRACRSEPIAEEGPVQIPTGADRQDTDSGSNLARSQSA